MTQHRLTYASIIAAGALALAVALPADAAAQSIQTYVSGHGSDNNPCTYAAPCRSFAHAITATIAGGTIFVLDPAQYGGQVTITKSINIVNDGVGAAIISIPAGGTGITVNAGPDGIVKLRGLTIAGPSGGGGYGIEFVRGRSLTIEHSVIRKINNWGISFTPNMLSYLTVSNTQIAESNCGIFVEPGHDGAVNAIIDRVLNNAGYGICLLSYSGVGEIRATISNSVFGNCAGVSVRAVSGAGPATATLFHSVVAGCNSGYDAGLSVDGPGATIVAAQSTVSGSTHGWSISNGGVIKSYGDNHFAGNGSNTGPLTPIARQ